MKNPALVVKYLRSSSSGTGGAFLLGRSKNSLFLLLPMFSLKLLSADTSKQN